MGELRRTLKNEKTFDKNKPYIFISYSHKDSEKVLKDVKELKKRGYTIWIDRDNYDGWSRFHSDNWKKKILPILKKARFVIVYFSENSFTSRGFSEECKHLYTTQDKPKKCFAFFIGSEFPIDK